MSDAIKHIDVDSEEFEDAPRALRDYVKKLQGQNQTLTKERDDARGSIASRAVADVLADKGFKNPERVKRDILADGIDPTDQAAVDTWLTSNGDDYAKAQAAPEEGQQEQPAAVSAEEQQAYQNLQVQGQTVPAGNDKFASVAAKITPDMRGADVEKLYREHGI